MSYFGNEVKVGSPAGREGGTQDWGYVAVDQLVAISANAGAGTKDHTFYLPKCRILAIYQDIETAWDSATSATLSVGTTGTPTLFTSTGNAKTAGRSVLPHTSAQCTQIKSVAAGTYIVQVVQVGAGSAGAGNVRIVYEPIKP
jgi:hypothetical protein